MDDWNALRQLVNRAFFSHFHSAIATVDAAGAPVVTPIGSLLLRSEPGEAFFFPVFAHGLVDRLRHDPRMSILTVDSRLSTWLPSLALGRFTSPVGVRMRATASGPARLAQPEETARWLKRVKSARWLPGHDRLWGHLDTVQDITVDAAEPIRMGEMTREHELRWSRPAVATKGF